MYVLPNIEYQRIISSSGGLFDENETEEMKNISRQTDDVALQLTVYYLSGMVNQFCL